MRTESDGCAVPRDREFDRWIWHPMIATAQKWWVIGDKAGLDDGYLGGKICYLVTSLLTVNIFITNSEMSISTYIPTYKGNSLRKSLHNHCCYFGFTFEVRFCHVISCICIGNANSQVSKSKALMCWFSQLISTSLGGFDVNCTDNISTLQNSIIYIK